MEQKTINGTGQVVHVLGAIVVGFSDLLENDIQLRTWKFNLEVKLFKKKNQIRNSKLFDYKILLLYIFLF